MQFKKSLPLATVIADNKIITAGNYMFKVNNKNPRIKM